MRRILRALAVLGFVVTGVLTLLGIAAWPPGGLMFALPYVFLWFAGLVGVASGIVFLLTRPRQQGPPKA